MGLGETGNFLSYGFAPASVVAPLGTVALIANCFFAPLILRESFTRRNVLGMTLAIVGAVTVVWSATDSKPRVSLPRVSHTTTHTRAVMWDWAVMLCAVCPFLWRNRYFSPGFDS